jgi:eukaryotic-like serine/threonine-protein kinase
MAQDSSSYAGPAPEPTDWKGTARYEVLSCLGRGGMGVVYEAFDRERRQLVAVKTLIDFDAAALYLFKQEFRTLADAQHANLVHLYELVLAESGHVFFTMELVRGTDFRQYVRRAEGHRTSLPSFPGGGLQVPPRDRETVRPGGPKGSPQAAPNHRRSPSDLDRLRPALRQLVDGVHALHMAGKLHRDIKPSNVLVTPEGRVVLLDFGVATELSKHAEEVPASGGEMVGTARYMAPEQADDEPPTPASDWYSVGVMLYEALVGRPPFVGSAVDVLTMKSTMDPVPASECVAGVPSDLDALCQALLHRDPAMRPTGAEVLHRLGVTRSIAPGPPPLGPAGAETTFMGRDRQLKVLREAFDAARAGEAITVRVAGASGMGKSAIVHHFLDELVQGGEAVVLRGRAYERESVPYKVVDSVIDALSRHLLRVADTADALALPEDAWALARLFPVLERVPGLGRAAEQPIDDPQGVRRRAFVALRALLASLTRRQPLVVFVDDVHWGDVDSAALLLELLRPPDAPPMLLVMTYRDSEAQTSPFLVELDDRWPPGAKARKVDVEPLDVEDSRRLALLLLDGSDELTKRTANAVARESRGSPFLIEELVRSNRGATSATGATLAVLTLDQMVSERLERLPEDARRIVEIVAVGGRPLPLSVVAGASSAERTVNEAILLLGARRFARTGLRDGREVVETIHERIRETIVAQLPPARLREHHGRLARTLEEVPGADAEAVAMHWLGAGDTERAARFAEGAAEQAATQLAFDQSARLFRLALENTPTSSADERRLRARFAQVLQHAGRHEESARAYLAAAEGAPADQRVEFHRAAADQLLTSGRIEEGAAMLRSVLAAAGMRAPQSPLSAVFWLLVYRLWLALVGLRFTEREPGEIRREDRLRIDALLTVSMGFAVVDVILGACMQARHLLEALRVGDRFQVLRATGIEAAHIAAAGKRESRRERALVEITRGLAERDGSLNAHAYYEGARGIGLFQRGRWTQAREMLELGQRIALHGNPGFSNVRLFAVYVGFFLGDLNETAKRASRLCAEAEDRGDLYTTVNLRSSVCIHLSLAADQPEEARRELREALAQWSQTAFHVQHWQAVAYGADIDLYVGESGRAYERFMSGMPALKRSFLLHSGFIRAMTLFTRGRLAIASIASAPELRGARIAEARRMARRLEREYDPWTAALAALVRAAADNAAGDRAAAVSTLRIAIERAETTDTVVFAVIARHRLGELLGGEEGRDLVRAAHGAMSTEGIRDPERWMAVFMPGNWGPRDAP